MKKIALIFSLLLTIISCNKEIETNSKSKSQVVEEATTRKVAQYFDFTSFTLKNSKFRQVDEPIIIKDKENQIALRVYNYTDKKGFIVVSAELNHEPICAYVQNGQFLVGDTVPSAIIDWYEETLNNILSIRKGQIDNSKRAQSAWKKLNLIEGMNNYKLIPKDDVEVNCESNWGSFSKGPLISTNWSQGFSYNNLCPNLNCSNTGNGRALTGCVATAEAQIIRYWNKGNSFNYNYSSMPNNSGNSEVQRLMKDVGISVGMNYGCDGSGAYSDMVPNSLKNTFGFSSAYYDSYNSGSHNIIKSNLNLNRPVYLAGCTSASFFLGIQVSASDCHAWICDGYNEYWNDCYSYLYLRMNWGWGGYGNGYYAFNYWSSPSGTFQYNKKIVYNIIP